MSAYLQQEYDFIERTKKIIEQYSLVRETPKYEVTLLLNCFVGLLILPQQHWYDKLPDISISVNEWGISPDDISFIKNDEKKDVKNVSRHLRNSVSHYRFIAFKDDANNINQIKFEDYNRTNEKTFEAILSIASIKTFIYNFSDFLCRDMQKEKM